MGKYFTLKEMCKSATAEKLGIGNAPTEEAAANIDRLINNVLDPVREKIREPIIVNSGYRSPKLNKAVGGVSTSQHVKGEAADITLRDKTRNRKLYDAVVSLGVYDQVIWEKGCDAYPDWVHVSYRTPLRKQKLRIR